MIIEIAQSSSVLAAPISEQADGGQTINRNASGAARNLEIIDGRVRDVTTAATDVDRLARQVSMDALRVRQSAAAIDSALMLFFKNLHVPNRHK